jgi:hypothetical protein
VRFLEHHILRWHTWHLLRLCPLLLPLSLTAVSHPCRLALAPTYLFLRFFEVFGMILENIFVVFLGSSCRETAKNAIKKIDGKR